MGEFTATQVSKPANEQDFEAANEILWGCILLPGSVQMHGHRGQKQDGVDIFGVRAGAPAQLVGIQAKLKSEGSRLTEKEVRDEVTRALGFKPQLSEYFIVTTSPDDAKLHQLALELSDAVSTDRSIPLKVRVYGWETMQRHIRRHPAAIRAFDPSHTSHGDYLAESVDQLTEKVDSSTTQISEILTLLKAQQRVDVSAIDIRNAHTADPEIDEYANLVRSEPTTAIRLLKSLQGRLGSSASGRTRFRVAANIAACEIELGDVEAGIRGLLDAYNLDPENPKAAANKAMALLLANDWPGLRAFAVTALARMPANAQLAGYLVQGSVGNEDASTIDALIPEVVQNAPEVVVARVRRAIDVDPPGTWHDQAIAAQAMYPDDEAIDEMRANALLDRIIAANGFRYGRTLSLSERVDVATAIASLQRHWDRTKTYRVGEARKYVSLPLNLITAYRLVHRTDDALRVAHEAMEWLPGNKDITERTAAVLLETGDPTAAEVLLDKIGVDAETVQLRFNLAMTAADWVRVVRLVDAHLDLFPVQDRGMVSASAIAGKVELDPGSNRQAILEEHRKTFSGDARGNAILAQSARMNGFEELSDHYYSEALLALKGDASFADRMAVADEAMKRAEPRAVADILLGQVDPTRDGPELRLLADALAHDFPIRERAAIFFETLPDAIRQSAAFKRLEAIYLINRGEPARAVHVLEEALRDAPHLITLVLLISTLLGLGQTDQVVALISDPAVETLPGPKLERIKLAQVMMDYGDKERAIKLGYEVLITATDRAPVVMRYFGLILKPQATPRLGFDAVVATGNWVKYARADGATYEGIIGEEADRPWGVRIDPANAFIAPSLGLGEGATFSIQNTLDVIEQWTVTEVKPRWLQAFHVMTLTFAQRFPDVQGFNMLTMQEGDITPTLDQVRRRAEGLRQHADLYLQQGIPMALVADHRSGGAIGFADYLMSIEQDVRACLGDNEERERALELIRSNAAAGAVLDCLTAWRAAELGVLDVVRDVLGTLAIPATELNKLKAIVDDEEDEDTGERMRLSYHKGQFIRETITAEDRAANKRVLVDRLATIEAMCSPEAVVIPDSLPEIAELLLEFPAADASAPLVMAGDTRLLLVEDLAMRQLGQQAFNAKGVWLQAVLLEALERKLISLERYADALVVLAAHRHGVIAVNVAVLRSVYERDPTDGLIRLQILLRYLGNEKADPLSHLSIACEFINGLWDGRAGVELKVQAATGHVMRALLTRPRVGGWARWAAGLWLGLAASPRAYLRDWLQGHFMPIALVEEAIRASRGQNSAAP